MVFSHIPKLPRLNDSIFARLALHLGGEQDVVHFVTGLILYSQELEGLYEEIT